MMIRENVQELESRVTEYQSPDRSLSLILTGALAGLISAGPMALVLLIGRHLLPHSEQYALPPRQITQEIAERTGMDKKLKGDAGMQSTIWLSHFAYAAVTGGIYPLAFRRLPVPTLLKGVLFGLAIWAGSYMGWLPALGILPPANRMPAGRNRLMVFAHLLWGTFISLFVRKMED